MATTDKLASKYAILELISEHSDLASVGIDDSLSVSSSDESNISARLLALHSDYSVMWQLINNCHEAAFTDIPGKYRSYLSIFDAECSRIEGIHLTEQRVMDDEIYEALFEVAGATNTISEPWSLPAPLRLLSDEDALWRQFAHVSGVSEVCPTAAIYLALNHDDLDISTPGPPDSSMSPLVHATAPRFATTVFASASHMLPHSKNVSFTSLRKYNRLATTSLLRQCHALKIETPIFGVLLHGSLVAIHVDWYEDHDGVMDSFSAFYPLDDEESGIKTWNLSYPSERREVVTILSSLRKYTYGHFASQVRHRLGSPSSPIMPWKWNVSCLSQPLRPTSLCQSPKEPSEDKIIRWRESLEPPKEQGAVPDEHILKQQSLSISRSVQSVELRSCIEFLSPPSTPGEKPTID